MTRWSLAFATWLVTTPVWGVEDPEIDAFAKVVVSETEMRSGPSASHRVVYRAERGETFPIEGREGSGYWLRVLLPDGRLVYVLGDTVEPIAVDPEAEGGPRRPGVFAPPALEEASGGFTLSGGIFDLDGYVEIRPALILAPSLSVEPYAGLALQGDARRLLYGLGATLNLVPSWAISPYLNFGLGGVEESEAGEFVREQQSTFHVRAGGGLLVSLRWRILFRLEANNFVLYTEDSYDTAQAYTAGLGTYF